MTINIGYDFINKKIMENNNKTINDEEYKILNAIIDNLKINFDISNFKIDIKSNDYLTLTFKDYDLVRVKYTDRAKWIKIYITNKDKYLNNILFENQKNKNELFWKSVLYDKYDINKFTNILKDTCFSINKK